MKGSPTAPHPAPLLVYGPWSPRYDLGPGHPLTPRRFGPGVDLLRAIAAEEPRLLAPEPASDDVLAWAHDRAYLRTVRRLSEAPSGPRKAGIGPGDTPAFAGMHDASAAVAGGSVAAMETLLRGDVRHVFHPGGGLHHAMPDHAAGFCVYNDPALAISRARREGLRVLYVDLDVHHGDGVQAIHWSDPGVLTVSIHQSGRTLFPGTGFVDELGEAEAAGTSVNLPLEPGTGEEAWLAVLRRLLPELAASFGPDVVVSQHGADAHAWDPLANLRVTTTAMGEAARLVDAIAHRWAGGRWLATGGGGYDVYRVVPRVWSLVWLAAQHRDQDQAIPEAWRTHWAADGAAHGQSPLPSRLRDEVNAGLPVDAAQIGAERAATAMGELVRNLTVPALLRAATDRGWWRALDDLAVDVDRGGSPGVLLGDAVRDQADAGSRRPLILDRIDPTGWEALELARGVLAPLDPVAAHRLVSTALGSTHDVGVSVAIDNGRIVGAVVSATTGTETDAARALLAVGVAPAWRGRGIATALLQGHLEASPGTTHWVAEVTGAERDPMAPLSRATRADLARRLLEGAAFAVQASTGEIGRADPRAITATR